MTQQDILLFQVALGIVEPWKVIDYKLDLTNNQLDIQVDFDRGSFFSCPVCGKKDCKAYDTEERVWRHLNFFQYKTFIQARVPRVDCPEHGIKRVTAPWSRPGSGFTMLMEAIILFLAKEMTVMAVARTLGEHDTRIWRVLEYYIGEEVKKMDCSQVISVGVDETSIKRGHNYVTLFVDLKKARVLFATEGKDATTIQYFSAFLKEHRGSPFLIGDMSLDMSPAFIKGCQDHFPGASLTFDKYHVQKIINDAMDKVRKEEAGEALELKGSRYLWLHNANHLSDSQKVYLNTLIKDSNLQTVTAYQMKLSFEEFWRCPLAMAEVFLQEWVHWVRESKLQPMIEAAETIVRHWQGIIRWFQSKINNGILEGLNSIIQATKRKARGYRTMKNFIMMIYLVAGKLEFKNQLSMLPT